MPPRTMLEKQRSSWQGLFFHRIPNLFWLRDGGHKAVLALIPGTTEQIQAEMAALRESIRNMQLGQGGPRINVPECPVIQNKFPLSFIFGFRFVLKRCLPRGGSSTASTVTLCVEVAGLAFRLNILLYFFIRQKRLFL